MALISDSFHKDKLNKYNINIKTKYIVGNEILEKNTNDSKNDNIKNGIRCEKLYYINNVFKHKETQFDSRIEYTYICDENQNEDYNCPNCGANSKLKDFIDGCPYCGTHYNMEYKERDLGSKYHYDMVLHNNTYRIVTAIIDIVISMILSFLFIKFTSRTFNNFDIYKILIYGVILSLILYYFFYIIDAYVVLGPIKKYKDKQNKKQMAFWKKTNIDKKTFFNNLNYEVGKFYYSKDNIIDYDILDYIDFTDYTNDNKLYVKVSLLVRVVYYNNNKITSKLIKDTFTLEKHNKGTVELKDGINIIMCHNCGASININKGYCEYCHTKIKYLQEWILKSK